MSDAEGVRLGPIRPEHLSDGWRLEGDQRGGWWLSRQVGELLVKVYATSPTTVAWGAYAPGGRMVREASARNVGDAKASAVAWIREHR